MHLQKTLRFNSQMKNNQITIQALYTIFDARRRFWITLIELVLKKRKMKKPDGEEDDDDENYGFVDWTGY